MCDNESAPLVISARGRIAAGSLRGEGYRLEQQPNDSSSVLASQHYQPSTHFCDTFPKLVLRGEAWGVADVCFRTCSTGKIKLILSNLYGVNLLPSFTFKYLCISTYTKCSSNLLSCVVCVLDGNVQECDVGLGSRSTPKRFPSRRSRLVDLVWKHANWVKSFPLLQVATIIAVYAVWGFANIRGIGWGWAGVIWLYSIVTYVPLDIIKFFVRFIQSGKAWEDLLESKVSD